MTKKYVLGIDQGTTGSTAMIFNIHSKKIVKSVNTEFPQIFPKPGWVEHDLGDIWESVKISTESVIKESNIDPLEILSIGITNQRETTCMFDREGKPLHNAIVWQDRRTSQFCLDQKSNYKPFQKKTGLPLDPYFSGTKIKWLIENSKKSLDFKNTFFSTIDSFLLYRLTGCKSFFTEPTNASRTLLMDLKTLNWDAELLQFFNIDQACLPKIRNTFDKFGVTSGLTFLPDGIPINCLFGDQQSALFGQGAIEPGDLKCTYGTGAFLLLNTGDKFKISQHGLLSTVAYKSENDVAYALEGSTYIAGAAVQFLRDNLEFFQKSYEIEALAQESDNSKTKDLFLFPFFSGLGSPFWKPDAKACLYGMTRGTSKQDISKVCLEGIAFSINDLLKACEQDLGYQISEIKVDGGATKNDFLMQIQSDVSKKHVLRPKIIETTVLGAILGSLVGIGELEIDDAKNFSSLDKRFSPLDKNSSYFNDKLEKWSQFISKVFN